MSYQEKFEKILSNYTSKDALLVHNTIDVLCSKGIGNGCYQDYAVLADVVNVLTIFEAAVAEKGN